MNMIVTGASGFLSRIVARAAAKCGKTVHGISRGAAGHAPDCSTVRVWPSSDDLNELAEWIADLHPQAIFHGAGGASVASSLTNPRADLDAAVGTWSRLLEATRLSGEKPLLIFPSSAAVYGNPQHLPVSEDALCDPISPYGHHKMMCETLAAEYRCLHALPVVVLRIFSIVGPSQRRLLVWDLFTRARAGDSTLDVSGTGRETRDYLGEDDLAGAVLLAMENAARFQRKDFPWIFNLAACEEQSVHSVATMVRDRVNPSAAVRCLGEIRKGDPVRWLADVSRFKQAFPEWRPRAFAEVLRDTIDAWSALAKSAPGAEKTRDD